MLCGGNLKLEKTPGGKTQGLALELPTHTISAETLKEAWQREMQQLASAGTVKRLGAKDESPWAHAKGQKQLITNNLNWLDLPDQIGPYMMRAAALAATPGRGGFRVLFFWVVGDAIPRGEVGGFLAAAEISGSDKLLLLSSKGLQASTYRIAQLVGASTSKGGHGLIPGW